MADGYVADSASFVLVGADVAFLARGTDALSQRFSSDDGATRAGY